MTLTDTHLVLLSAAAQRDDRLLVRPDRLRGQAAEKLATKLLAAGLVGETVVRADEPHWRSARDGSPLGLRLLRAGFDALGIEPDGGAQMEWSGATQAVAGLRPAMPQRGTKRTALIAMLQREEGASVDAIMTAMGWLPHSTRAALTGLRKGGHQIFKGRDDDGHTVYRLVVAAAVASDAAHGPHAPTAAATA